MSEQERPRGGQKSGVFETRSPAEVTQTTAKIMQLEATRDRKRIELADLRVFHADAYKTYGSELCANGMIREEREVEAEVKSLEDDIALLQAFLRGEQGKEAPVAEMRLEAIAGHRKVLERQTAEASQEVLRAQRLAQLLKGG